MPRARSIHDQRRIVGGRRPRVPAPAAPRRAPCACAPDKRQSAAPPSSREATRQPPPLPVFLKPMQRRRTLWTLYAVNFLNATGMWFFLPLLPIFLGRKGGSAALVGVVFAAGLLANAVVRYPAGWAADRF